MDPHEIQVLINHEEDGMKKPIYLVIIVIGLSLLLTACPSPSETPPSLGILTPFDGGSMYGHISREYYETPYVVQLGTPASELRVIEPEYYYPVTPIAYPDKIRVATLPSVFFDILRAYVVQCDGEYYAVAQVVNLGGFAFESAALSVQTLFLNSTSTRLNSPFIKDSNLCPVGDGSSRLMPGHKAYLYQPFEPDLRYPCVNYLVTLCSKDNMRGYCAEGGFGVCQYAVDSSPKDTPTPTPVQCDFDCDCEPDQGETENTCPKDCPDHCGNGVCDCDETQDSCSKDCGKPEDPCKNVSCGDGICQSACGENIKNCQADCP
jgi:hypothetical protein